MEYEIQLPIKFKLEQTEKDKELSKIMGYEIASKVQILRPCGKEIGHIFSPSGSGNDIKNAIQVCGFSEAFEFWGCGVFKGYKDIQLLFDDGVMGGKSHFDLDKCCRCYRNPCQCENKVKNDGEENILCENMTKKPQPFNVKSFDELKERLIIQNKKD